MSDPAGRPVLWPAGVHPRPARFGRWHLGSRAAMRAVDDLEHAETLDGLVGLGQRWARLLRPGRCRDALYGVWLGHPLHPVLAQAPIGLWLSATVLDVWPGDGERASRRLVLAGLAAAVPAALAGAVDWSEQHEQQMRVGTVHAMANGAAVGLVHGVPGRPHPIGVARAAAGRAGHGRSGRAAWRPHLVPAGWRCQPGRAGAASGPAWLARSDAGGGTREPEPGEAMLGEVPVVVVRDGREVHVLAERCSHLSGPLSEGELAGRLPDLSVARQRVPGQRRGGGAWPCHRPAAGVSGSRDRRRHPGLPARRRLTGRPGRIPGRLGRLFLRLGDGLLRCGERGQQPGEAARRPGAGPGGGDHGDPGRPQQRNPRGQQVIDQGVVLGRRQRPETADGEVGVRGESQVGAVDVRMVRLARPGSAGRTAVAPGAGDQPSRRPSRCPARPSIRGRRSGAGGGATSGGRGYRRRWWRSTRRRDPCGAWRGAPA